MGKHKIKGKKTSENGKKWLGKKIATLLSAGLLMLSTTACETKEKIEEEPYGPINITLCDTSYINLDGFLEDYESEYEAGKISNGSEMYEYYGNLYEMLCKEEIEEPTESSEENIDDFLFEESTSEENDKKIKQTYNFDMSPLQYEEESGGYFYSNGKEIKSINFSSVELMTVDGKINLKQEEESYYLTNTNENEGIETIVQYNSDGSYVVTENSQEENLSYEFDESGILVESSFYYNGHQEEISSGYKKYKNGDINYYDTYDSSDSPVEKMYDNGEIDVIRYNSQIDKNRYRFKLDDGGYIEKSRYIDDYYNEITYSYDENGNLSKIIAYDKERDDTSGELYKMNVIFQPNGNYYKFLKTYNKEGKLTRVEKTERQYNDKRSSIITDINENGEEIETLLVWDYKCLPESKNERPGDYVYEKIGDNIVIEQKDDVIYHYDRESGEFREAYKREENGTFYYRENGSLERFDGIDGVKKSYDEQGEIINIDNGMTSISYYDYKNELISYYKNNSDKVITTEINGQKLEIKPGSHVDFYKDGKIRTIYNSENDNVYYLESGSEWVTKDGITTYYDENHNITGISKDGITTFYYDYNNNIVKSKKIDDIEYEYYENQSIKIVRNYKKGDEIINYAGYDLRNGSFISFFENGNVDRFYYDENYSISYYETGEEKTIEEQGTRKVYDKNYNIIEIDADGKCTQYYDYENNIISYIGEKGINTYFYENQQIKGIDNYSKEAIISGNDIYGTTYELAEGDSVGFNQDGSIFRIKNGDITTIYYRRNDPSYYYVIDKEKNLYTFYCNDEVLYSTNDSNSFSMVQYNWDDGSRIVFNDGTTIPAIPEQQNEETEPVQSEEPVQSGEPVQSEDDNEAR